MGARAGTDDPHRPVVMLGDDDRLAASESQAARAVARLAQMQRIAAALSGRLEPDEVAEVIIRDTAPELGGVSRALWLLDESGSRLRLVRSEQHPRAAPFADLAVDGDLPGSEVARSGAPIFVEHLEERDRRYPSLAGLNNSASFAALPLTMSGGTVAGVLALAYDDTHEFGPDERSFLIAVADLAAQALERAHLHAVEARRTRDLAILAEASAVLARSLDYRETLDRVAHLTVGDVADLTTVHLFDGAGRLARVALAHRDHLVEVALAAQAESRLVEPPDSELVRVTQEGVAVLVTEVTPALVDRVALDETHARDIQRIALRSTISAPLIGRSGPIGTINFARVGSSLPFDENDRVLAEELARRAAMAIDNALLHQRQGEQARMLQRSLLPPALPEIAGLRLGAAYRAAGEGAEVGGDFYDVFEISDSRWGVMIGDVCGTGAAAAAITGQVRHTARAVAFSGASAVEVVNRTNDALAGTIGEESFCTMVFGILVFTAEGARVELVTAGHPPPLLITADRPAEELAIAGPLLGVFKPVTFTATDVPLRRGEALLLYTDGVLEARSAAGEYFDTDRLLASVGPRPAPALVADVERVLLAFTGGRLLDDVALLAIEVTA